MFNFVNESATVATNARPVRKIRKALRDRMLMEGLNGIMSSPGVVIEDGHYQGDLDDMVHVFVTTVAALNPGKGAIDRDAAESFVQALWAELNDSDDDSDDDSDS